jgi:diacylglycerol kinase (ATP)
MRIAIIVNPVSGREGRRDRTGAERLAHARRLVDRRVGSEVEPEVIATKEQGHAAELARGFLARDFDVVMAWGGDGTVNEVAGPLIGSRAALGIIPSGSGDGLARGLGLRVSAGEAFRAAVIGRSAPMDVGYLDKRHFLNVAGIGFDAAVAADFNRASKRGAFGYVTRSWRNLWSYRPDRYVVELDRERRDGRYLLVAFANGREYGNRLVLAPEADVRDGWLDAVLVEDGSPVRQLWRARRLALASSHPAAGILRTRIRTAAVTGDRLICHVDGESFQTAGTVEVRVDPMALKIIGLNSAFPRATRRPWPPRR